MGKAYSTLFGIYAAEFTAGVVVYHSIFWKIFAHCENTRKLNPKQSLLFATNTLSTIHSVWFLSSFYDFFINKRWQKPLIDEPRLGGHIWSIGTAYFVVDLLGHIICFLNYNKKVIPRRWDIIAHHIVCGLGFFLWEIPTPIYAWNIASLYPLMEISTIFLNLQWFARHYKHIKMEKISKILFLVTWLLVRVPITIYTASWLFMYHNKIFKNYPMHVYVSLMVMV
eukprot:3745_1